MRKARFISSRELAPETRHFDFEVIGPEPLRFDPGQFISIVHLVNGREITRAYSIASPRSRENRFSLCLNRVAAGLVSPFLFALAPGDEIEVGDPLGYFTLRHPGRHVVFIATGTGIAPFRSMLLEYLPKYESKITLLFGARFEEGLLYRAELEDLASEHSHFNLLPTITRPTESWKARTGRVQLHIEEALAMASPDPATIDVYICGLKEMVEEVRTLLKGRGLDRKQIISEKYD